MGEAVEDAHQGGLAGAVLAQQGMDLPTPDVQVDIVVREEVPEALGDARQPDGGDAAAGHGPAGSHPTGLVPVRRGSAADGGWNRKLRLVDGHAGDAGGCSPPPQRRVDETKDAAVTAVLVGASAAPPPSHHREVLEIPAGVQ
jgi:hypothetical protein